MSTEKVRGRLDAHSESLLYQGANLSELTLLFKADHRTLKAKMYGMKPVGKRGNAEIYDVSEVASRMGKLTEEQVDAAMKRLNHDDLPKALTKEYWAGKRSKQEYEFRNGDLWQTVVVVEKVGDMVKSLKMELDLLIDGIERQAEMSTRQREIANGLIRGCKANMLKKLRENFTEAEKPLVNLPAAPVRNFDDDDDEI